MEELNKEIKRIDIKQLGKISIESGDMSYIESFCRECYTYFQEYPTTNPIVNSFIETYVMRPPHYILEEFLPHLIKLF
jgi:hypothetical protein